jgi:hypothetical protein
LTVRHMSPRRVVVDGSNIATEGRSTPSLAQLDEAVRAFREESPTDEITVVVDATFAHRIDESERAEFEEAAAHGELVYPPAGAVGRGDAFLLRIAEKTDAIVLSNDSFQEFHGEHDWLFTKGRLIGGMPVPGVGWVFVPRTPVRGPKSREAVKEAKKSRARVGSKEAAGPAKKAAKKAPEQKKLERAIAEATEEAVAPDDESAGGGRGGRRRRRRRGGSGSGAKTAATPSLPTLNEPLTFITFIAEHKLGQPLEAEVESFASHGAFAMVGGARCYVPLSAMGNPPPRSAREVLTKGETRTFVLQALDAPRRGIELALPGFEKVSGHPTEETVEAEITESPAVVEPAAVKKAAATGKKATATKKAVKKAAKATKTTKKSPTKKATSPSKKATASRKKVAADPVTAEAIPIVPEVPREVPVPVPVATKKKAAATKAVKAVKKATTPATKKKAAAKKAIAAKKTVKTAAKATKKAPATKKTATAAKKTATAAKKTKKAAVKKKKASG